MLACWESRVKVGEFQYDLTGVVEPSSQTQETLRVPQTLYTNKKYSLDLNIPTRNDLIQRARKVSEYLADKLERKQKDSPRPNEKNYPKLGQA